MFYVGLTLAQERDAAGKHGYSQFFPQGEKKWSSAYYYTRDHLGSIRELVASAERSKEDGIMIHGVGQALT